MFSADLHSRQTQSYLMTDQQKIAIRAALEDDCWQRRYYFDVETGSVVCVTEGVRSELQAIYDEQGEDVDGLPSAELRRAHQVEMDDERFLRVPAVKESEKLARLDDFAAQTDPALRGLLFTALDRRDTVWAEQILGMEPDSLGRWQTFWNRDLDEKFQRWLADH